MRTRIGPILGLLLLLMPTPLWALALDATGTGSNTTGSTASATVSAAASGRVLLAFIGYSSTTAIAGGGVTGGSLTWTFIDGVNVASVYRLECWAAVTTGNPNGATISATLPASLNWAMSVSTYSGGVTSSVASAVDSHTTASNTSTNPTVSLTTVGSNIWRVGGVTDANTGMTAGSGFTLDVNNLTGAAIHLSTEISNAHQVAAGAGTVNFANSNNAPWNLVAVGLAEGITVFKHPPQGAGRKRGQRPVWR